MSKKTFLNKYVSNRFSYGQSESSDHQWCGCPEPCNNGDHRGHCSRGVGCGGSSGCRTIDRNGMFALHFMDFVSVLVSLAAGGSGRLPEYLIM